ncbi:MAG: (4Fe-4S)-binding protein [Cyclobacteriaceae bacterium]|nr:(4Fe-4S)-binding protein [Cyclobacteriaceae bacterium]
MKDITKKYTNGEVTIVWKPSLCIHSRNCFTGLGEVFHPQELPWVTPERSTTDKIIAQIKKCPSGALSYYMSAEAPVDAEPKQEAPGKVLVEPSHNGPLMVHGTVEVKQKDGTSVTKGAVTAFCRCGASANKPFCDGSHRKIGFQG